MATRGFLAWLDRFTPPVIRDDPVITMETRLRARVMVGWYLFVLFGGSAALLFTLGFYFMYSHAEASVIFAVLVMVVVFALQFGFFYRTGNVENAAIFFSMTFFIICVGTVIATGSWLSPAKPLMFCVPITAFLVGGRKEGVYMSCLAAGVVLLLFWAHMSGFQSPQIIVEDEMDIVALVIWMITMVTIFSCLLIYDIVLSIKDKARRINTKYQ